MDAHPRRASHLRARNRPKIARFEFSRFYPRPRRNPHAPRPAHPTQMELNLLLSDLGMLSGVNQEADERFVRSTFRKMDVDESGYIDFEEFKVIYNKAIDRKKGNDEIADLPPLRGRDVKALSPEVEAQRRRIAERKAQEKAEREAMLAEENRRKSQRIAEARARGKGRQVPGRAHRTAAP